MSMSYTLKQKVLRGTSLTSLLMVDVIIRSEKHMRVVLYTS